LDDKGRDAPEWVNALDEKRVDLQNKKKETTSTLGLKFGHFLSSRSLIIGRNKKRNNRLNLRINRGRKSWFR
jgi:hypothetical protein